MPVIKSAKKKLKQDRKRKQQNDKWRNLLKDLIKKARKNPTDETVKKVTKVADKSVKKNIIPKNKAAHIKSSLAKLLSAATKKGATEKQVVQVKKKAAAKKKTAKK